MNKTIYLSYAVIPTKRGWECWITDSTGARTWVSFRTKTKALAWGEALIS